MTDIHSTIQEVEASQEFQEFKQSNEHHYLVHVFSTAAQKNSSMVAEPVELGYYSKEADMITVFRTNPITALPPEGVFKEHGVLAQLDLPIVKVGLQDALVKAEQYRKENYPRHEAMKAICVLQQQQTPLWNITIVTNTVQMINLKIDATTGILLSRTMQSIMDLAQNF